MQTGTLTEEGLDVRGIVCAKNGPGQRLDPGLVKPSDLLPSDPLLHCLVACHSLILNENELLGDPLELKLFQSTQWSFSNCTSDDNRIAIIYPNAQTVCFFKFRNYR